MAETTNLNIRIDKDLKERAEAVFADMGMSMTTAFNIFVRQTLRQGGSQVYGRVGAACRWGLTSHSRNRHLKNICHGRDRTEKH